MAVRAPLARVLDELKESLSVAGVGLESVAGSPSGSHINAGEAAGWAMLELEGRLMPRIAVDLSQRMRTEVLGIDVYEQYNYEHVCRIVLGEPTLVYTMWQAEIVEQFPRDLTPLLSAAYARTRQRFPAGVRERLERGDWAGEESSMFVFFSESIAPIDVLGLALKTWEDPEEQLDLDGPVDALTMSVVPPRFWVEMSGLPLDIAKG
jgi:hypothetical protein